MSTFKSLNTLLERIKKDVVEIMQSKEIVEDAVGQAFSNAVKSEVYTQYQPLEYKRRKDNDGLSDKKNVKVYKIKKNKDNINIDYINMTKAYGEDFLLGALVEFGDKNNPYGLSYDYKKNRLGTQDDYLKPRNFDREAVEILKKGALLPKVLKRKFKEKGYIID